MQADIEAIKATGTQVVGISYDSVEVLQGFAKQAEISFLLLADEESSAIDAYGIRNEKAKVGSRYDGIPYPGTYLIDSKGVVRAKLFLDGYAQRHPVDELVEAANKIK